MSARFEERLAELRVFIGLTDRLPRLRSDNEAEQTLGRWLAGVRYQLKNGALTGRQVAALAAVDLTPNSDRTWEHRFEELKAFIARSGRRPAQTITNGIERGLSSWLNTQLQLFKKGRLPTYRREQLDAVLPGGLDAKLVRTFEENAAALAAFHAEHGRLPIAARAGEEYLGQWMLTVRMDYKDGVMPAGKVALLAAVPGALDTRRNPDQDETLDEARAWCATHGRQPRKQLGREPKNEAEAVEIRIGQWMRNHVREEFATTPAKKARRGAILNLYASYPEVTEFKRVQRAREIRAQLEATGHIPSSQTDPGVQHWIDNHDRLRASGAELDPEVLAALDLAAQLPKAMDAKRDARLGELEEFISRHGRMPGFAGGASKEEKALAFWVKRRLDGSRTHGGPEVNRRLFEIIAEYGKAAQQDVARLYQEADDAMAHLKALGAYPESGTPLYSWLQQQARGKKPTPAVTRVLVYAAGLPRTERKAA